MKKYIFFSYLLFPAMATILMSACCGTGRKLLKERIRNEVSKEYAVMLDSLTKLPKNILTNNEIKTVSRSFESLQLKDSGEVLVHKFGDGREVKFNGNRNSPEFFMNINGIKKPVLGNAVIDLSLFPRFRWPLIPKPKTCFNLYVPDEECMSSCDEWCSKLPIVRPGQVFLPKEVCVKLCERWGKHSCPLRKIPFCL